MKKNKKMTRRRFFIYLLSVIGSITFGFGIFNFIKNMKKIFKSDYFENGKFKNIIPVNIIEKGTSLNTTKRWIFGKTKTYPKRKFTFTADIIPEKVSDELKVMWTCHSSVYLEIEGKRFFCDPVWSKYLSPVGFGGPKRFFKPPLDINNIPDLDGVLISHDHMDHLDKKLIMFLSKKNVSFYVPIGVDYILKSWGIPDKLIFSADWYEDIIIDNAIKLTSLPAIHFSGRGLFDKNKSQWTSWVIQGKNKKVYFGGDSGYHHKFKEYGDKFGPFDITCLEIGAYDKNWRKIHLGPENAVLANKDLNGKVLLPIHWGAYDLAVHSWREPVERLIKEAEKKQVNIALPKPGQLLSENDFMINSRWWET
jgi:L-ascorbate metabolism protein UlaG (beta-lactamase superfamily)